MADKKNTRRLRLPVNTGIRTDTFSEDVPLLDINDYVLLPDGSGLAPREGFEIRRQDSIGVGVTRKSVFFVRNPPDIDGGDLLVIVNDANGDRRVETTELVTAAVIDDTVYSNSTFRLNVTSDGIFFAFPVGGPYTSTTMIVSRGGDTTGAAYCTFTTSDDTAVAGTDYTAVNSTLNFAAGETSKNVVITINGTGQPTGKKFNVQLSNYSTGSGQAPFGLDAAIVDMSEG